MPRHFVYAEAFCAKSAKDLKKFKKVHENDDC
jgi:hypothetical protein